MKTVKTNAMRLLDKAHIAYQVHEYPHGNEAVDGENVAKLLNEDVSCVFKTLITQANTKEYLVWMVPAAAQLDLKKAAAAAGVKHLLYVPDYIFNHRHKYDTLYISYDEPIRQDAGDHGLKLYDGYRHAVSGPLIIDFVNAAEKYSGYDVSDIRRELKRKSDWFDEKYGKEHLHE